MIYRKLTSSEIEQLNKNSCTCSNWEDVKVSDQFDSAYIKNVQFSGEIKIGAQSGSAKFNDYHSLHSGIYNSRIHNCTIGDNVFINDVKLLSNYSIEDDVTINNVAELCVVGETSFGNGAELDIVNEAGGRTLKIFDKLSSNLAYVLVFYRHNKTLIDAIEKLIVEYSNNVRSDKGRIGIGSQITNTVSIVNVNIGEFSVIKGASKLFDGTAASTKEDPIFIGSNVSANNFIVQSGSIIDDGALLHHCFVGQGVKMGKQYSAENSAFFANSEAFHGEACSIFGGPYTVTHHKSSLLIAGYYSFYNAGSGTNQSNHMYKLGPLHQGILERGSKTGSFSYMLWPCRTAPFTTIIGKHYANFDTSNLPFSYISEEDGKSYITPSLNLFAVGTRRDSQKWKKRDRRKASIKYDQINFDLFSPFIVGKMLNAIDELNELYENTPKSKTQINYHGINLRRLLLKSSRKYYEMGVKIFIGNCLVKRLKGLDQSSSWSDINSKLIIDTSGGLERWRDICGLLAPGSQIDELLNKLENGKLDSLRKIQNEFELIQKSYDENEWKWCAALIEKSFDVELENITKEILISILNDWKVNSIRLNNMIINDAKKEFDSFAKIGFGIDGNDEIQNKDFEAVRGTADENSFIQELNLESSQIEKTAESMFNLLESQN